jgi:hypothetical protein
MTAKEKELVLKRWVRFVKNGFRMSDFTKALYEHCINHCSFIAHFNRGGFYATYFEQPEMTAHFLTQFDKDRGCVSIEYGDTYWLTAPDYQDINSAMCDAIEPYKKAIYQDCATRERDRDLATARALLEKHHVSVPA